MGIHVNLFIECEATSPGLRIQVAKPYVRVRRTVNKRPIISAFYFLWFAFDDGRELFVTVEPQGPTFSPDKSEKGLLALQAELSTFPEEGSTETRSMWFDLPRVSKDNGAALGEQFIYSSSCTQLPCILGEPQVLNAWLKSHGLLLDEFARALAVVNPPLE